MVMFHYEIISYKTQHAKQYLQRFCNFFLTIFIKEIEHFNVHFNPIPTFLLITSFPPPLS